MLLPLTLPLIFPHALAQIAWPASGPEVCVVPSTVNIRPWTTCADVDSVYASANTKSAVLVNAQRGETESVQVLVRKDIDLDDDREREHNRSCRDSRVLVGRRAVALANLAERSLVGESYYTSDPAKHTGQSETHTCSRVPATRNTPPN